MLDPWPEALGRPVEQVGQGGGELVGGGVERGDPRTARRHLRAAHAAASRAKDTTLLGRVLNNLASVSAEMGNPRHAERQLRAALEAKRRGGAGPVEIGRTLFNLAEVALEQRGDGLIALGERLTP